MSLQTTRVFALISLFIVTYIVGVIPLYLLKIFQKQKSSQLKKIKKPYDEDYNHSFSSNLYIQVMLQFGGGVLFATIFAHLIPDVKENFLKYSKSNETILSTDQTKETHGIPYVELAICLGFFAIFFIDELIHSCLNRYHERPNEYSCQRDIMNRCQEVPPVDNNDLNRFNQLENYEIIDPNAKLLSRTHNNYGTGLRNETSVKCCQHSNSLVSSGISTDSVSDKIRDKSTTDSDHSQDPILIAILRGFMIIFAFSVHSIFDGLSIGLQKSTFDIWSMFLAITTHKVVIAFVVSMELYDQSRRFSIVAFHMALFSLMSPIGILIVVLTEESLMSLQSETSSTVIFLTSIATGTLLYIVFYEILQKNRCSRLSGLVQFASVFLGFILMLSINLFIS